MIQTNNPYFFSNPVVPNISNIKYGYLYNWYAASNPLFAPEGWHVPTQTELQILLNFIDIYDPENDNWPLAGSKLKEIGTNYWDSNIDATNELNMNFRGSGFRAFDGPFYNSLKDSNNILAIDLYALSLFGLSSIAELTIREINHKNDGHSIRLIKNNSVFVSSLTDLDNNIYRTIKVGTQVWLADNWACTKLNDGTPITNITDDTLWAADIDGAYCAYDNDENNVFL